MACNINSATLCRILKKNIFCVTKVKIYIQTSTGKNIYSFIVSLLRKVGILQKREILPNNVLC